MLDDDEARHRIFAARYSDQELVGCRTSDECFDALDTGGWDLAFLDHDLNDFGLRSFRPGMYGGSSEVTGTDVAYYIANMPAEARPKKVVVHSWNPPGAQRMVQILQDAGVDVKQYPFDPESSDG